MSEEEIRLSTENSGFPVDICKSRNGKPVCSNFVINLKNFPQLRNSVIGVAWLSVDRKLHLTLEETAKLDVLKWMEFIKHQYVESQKSPFVDIDTNSTVLVIVDINQNEIGKVQFKRIKLETHSLAFDKNNELGSFGLDREETKLVHHICLSYEDCAITFPEDPVSSKVDESDREWQQVELI